MTLSFVKFDRTLLAASVMSVGLLASACSGDAQSDVTSATTPGEGVGRIVSDDDPATVELEATTVAPMATNGDGSQEPSVSESSRTIADATPVPNALAQIESWSPAAALGSDTADLCPGVGRPSESVVPTLIDHRRWTSVEGSIADLRSLDFVDSSAAFSFWLHAQRATTQCADVDLVSTAGGGFTARRTDVALPVPAGASAAMELHVEIADASGAVAQSVTVMALIETQIVELRILGNAVNADGARAARDVVAAEVTAIVEGSVE